MVDIDLAMMLLISEVEEEENAEKRKRKLRNFGVHDLWKKRRISGEFISFCADLYVYPSIYYDYYKMNYDQFENLVNILKPHTVKQETKLTIPISVEERISVCLR